MDGTGLKARFRERDESVLYDVQKEYGKACYGIAYGILKNKEDAEEAVSDALFAVWNSIPPADPPSFEAYLYKSVRNKAMSRLRMQVSEKRRANTVPFDEIEDFIPAEWSVDDAVDTGTITSVINSFLGSLPELTRRLFVCRYFSAMEIKEISKKYGISQGRIRTLLDGARKKLKEKLKKEGYTYE